MRGGTRPPLETAAGVRGIGVAAPRSGARTRSARGACVRRGPSASVAAMLLPPNAVLDPDGTTSWVGRHGAVVGFDRATREATARIEVDLPVRALAMRRDGRVLAVAGFRDVRKRTVLSVRTLALPSGEVIAGWSVDVGGGARPRLVFAPDGRALAVMSISAHRFALDERGALADPWPSPFGQAPATFDPSGRFAACASLEGVCLLDSKTGERRTVAVPERTRVFALAFSPDGARLALHVGPTSPFLAKGESERIVIVDSASARPIATWSLSEAPADIAFSLDGAHLEVATGERDVLVLDPRTGARVAQRERVWAGPPAPVLECLRVDALAFVAGRLVTRSGARLRAWDFARGVEVELPPRAELALHPPEQDPERGLAARAAFGGRTWRSMGDDEEVFDVVELAELKTGRSIARLGTHEGPIGVVRFTRDGWLVSGDSTALWVWDPERRVRVASLSAQGWRVAPRPVAIADDAGWIAAAGRREREGDVCVFAVSGALVSRIAVNATALALDRATDRIAIGEEDGAITIARASDGELLAREQRHWASIAALAFDGSGALLASADYDGAVVVRETPAARR